MYEYLKTCVLVLTSIFHHVLAVWNRYVTISVVNFLPSHARIDLILRFLSSSNHILKCSLTSICTFLLEKKMDFYVMTMVIKAAALDYALAHII